MDPRKVWKNHPKIALNLSDLNYATKPLRKRNRQIRIYRVKLEIKSHHLFTSKSRASMKTKKIRLGVLFGGKSAEHEISLISAKNVIEALDNTKYDIFLIGIDKNGEWRLRDGYSYLMHADNPKLVHLHGANASVALVPKDHRKELVSYSGNQLQESLLLDVIFPVLHGTYGEDGTVQGLLKLANTFTAICSCSYF